MTEPRRRADISAVRHRDSSRLTMTFLIFILLLTRQSYSLSRPQCHSCRQTSCNCSTQNLRRVPAAPSKLVTELDLSFNRLGSISNNDFVTFAGLQSLIMNNNTIRTIHEQAFVPLIHLEKLDLSFNRLGTLSAGWFETLSRLRHLNLLGNNYKTLGQGNLFKPLRRLKTLRFGGPSLQFVGENDFFGLSDLEEVVFDGQNLLKYTKGSLGQMRPVKHVTLNLDGPFEKNQMLATAVLVDVRHPNTSLTFTDMRLLAESHVGPFQMLTGGGTRRIVFKNMKITIPACAALLLYLSLSDVTMFAIEETEVFLGYFDLPFSPSPLHRLVEFILKDIEIPEFYSFPALFDLKPLLNVVRRMSLINCKLYVLPCQTSSRLTNLEFMDVSENILGDQALHEIMCDGKVGLQNLKTLNISRNHLQTINSHLFASLEKLENIDMSGNKFHVMPETCSWPPRVRFLNLSSSHLINVTTCLPESLHVLDVSNNALAVFAIKLPLLRELYISGNKLSSLPHGVLYPRLTFLSILKNDLQTFSKSVLDDYDNLKTLEAGSDTYVCSCDFVAFMTSDLRNHRVVLGDDIKSYICDSADAVRGQSVVDVRLSVFECHTVLALSLLCLGILVVFLLVAGLCHKFNLWWYMKMTLAWLRAKRKPKLKKGELEYDAFVSYSEMDSGWVETYLVPELEQAEPPLRLCLHKRDFTPGGWILDNIMDAIEKSHRTLFVLSQHFVRSEWCKYELDYTHFRLFDHNDDTVVLILLEPIDKETIPKKFCKLRKVMNSRTYLEWPDDDEHIPRFWQSLRAAIKRP